MHRRIRISLSTGILIGLMLPITLMRPVTPAAEAAQSHGALQLHIGPTQIYVGRDITLRITVGDARGHPVGALVSVSGTSHSVFGNAVGGSLTLVVHATKAGTAVVRATRAGYTTAVRKVPIVPGSPATVVAVKAGLTVIPPRAKPRAGRIGTDLFASYQAQTNAKQYASLNLRDGTLVDLNRNTTVAIKDPLHETLSGGELFIQVVHGAGSHQIQVGSAVAATKGTVLDVTFNAKSKTASVTVIEGQVQVSNNKRAVLIGAGQRTTIVAALPPTPPVRVNVTTIVSWVSNVPRASSRVNPPVLNVPPPSITTPPTAPTLATPTITVTGQMATSRWSGGPYRLQRHVDVPAGTTLTIAAGTIIEMDPYAYMTVEGTLIARSASGAPIIFTSSLTQAKPGSWDSLTFAGKGASGSVLDHVQVYYGGYSSPAEVLVTGGATPTIGNSVFADSGDLGVYVDDQSLPTITGCVFAGNVKGPASLPANDVTLVTASGFGAGESNIQVRGAVLSQDAVWTRTDMPLTINGHLDVPIGKSLTLAAGSVLEMDPYAYVTVEGTLTARGTGTTPIIVTSSAAQPVAGNWDDLAFNGGGSSGSVLDHVEIFYGGYSSSGELMVTNGAHPLLSNLVIAQASTRGLYVDDSSQPTVMGCIFSGDGPLPVSLPANAVASFTGGGFSSDAVGVVARGGMLTRKTTWTRTDVPLFIEGHLDVPINQTLILGAGATVDMEPYAYFTVEGTLTAEGTTTAPIVVTSSQEQATPGSWDTITLSGPGANASSLDNVQVLFGGYSSEGEVVIAGGATPQLRNILFAESSTTGLFVDETSHPTVTNCQFSSNSGGPASVPADALGGMTDGSFDATTGITVRGDILTRSATWTYQNAPLIVTGHLDIPLDITLILGPGSVVQMKPYSYITVEGTIDARGTAGTPIVFTSSLAQPAAGSWDSITLSGPGANASVLDRVQISYGGYSSDATVNVNGSKPVISNSLITQSRGGGIRVDNTAAPTIVSCHFEANTAYAISVPKGTTTHLQGNTYGPGQRGVETRP